MNKTSTQLDSFEFQSITRKFIYNGKNSYKFIFDLNDHKRFILNKKHTR